MAFLDGLRGLAALYVLLFHVYELFLFYHREQLSRVVKIAIWWMGYGHYAVDIFIVLSGFCLMLPVASPSNTSQRLRGGVGQYLLRRAKRILPPYYAALIISLLLVCSWKQMQDILQGRAPEAAHNVLAHFLLLHNLHKDWNMGIDPALWSVATEWQIYFMLPLLLLPVWRRFGIFASVVVAFLVGLAPHFLLPSAWNYDWACPWYLGLFALGMLGAVIANATSGRLRSLYLRAPWPWLLLISAAISLIILFSHHAGPGADAPTTGPSWILDTWIGITTVCLILSLSLSAVRSRAEAIQNRSESEESKSEESKSEESKSGRRSLFLSIFENRIAMFLGSISYSVYLLHEPVYGRITVYLNRLTLPADLLCGLLFLVVVPLLLLICYLFYIIFERPWTRSGARSKSLKTP